jgi:D-inositol-3-phosphate glycosyltransferase
VSSSPPDDASAGRAGGGGRKIARRPALVMVGEVPQPVGGVAEWCYQVCAGLERGGTDVHLIDTERNPTKDPPSGLASYQVVSGRNLRGLPVAHSRAVIGLWARQVPSIIRPLGVKATLNTLLLATRISFTVRSSGAAVVVAHHASVRGLAALIAARATGASCTVVVHGAEFVRQDSMRARPIARFVVREADQVITPSIYSRNLCVREAGPRPIAVLMNGVDHSSFRPDIEPLGWWDGELVVLFVGHLHPRKGPEVLANAIPLIKSTRAVRYVFAGPDRGSGAVVRGLLEASGVASKVTMLGVVPKAQLARLHRRADIFVFPTSWETEGFGLVAAEAMASGTPVVASRIGAIPEVVLDGESGLLVTPNDAKALAVALQLLIEDDQLRGTMGRAAADRARRFTWSGVIGALAEAARGTAAPPRARSWISGRP